MKFEPQFPGRVHKLIQVPVPAARIMRGDIIRNKDLIMVDVRATRVSRNAITDPSMVVGQSARQSLAGGVPIAPNAIQAPVLVKKGSMLTVHLQSSNMNLSVRARALEDGGINDVVQVRNKSSNRTFEVEVTGFGVGRVESPFDLASR